MNEINRSIVDLWNDEHEKRTPGEYFSRMPQFFFPNNDSDKAVLLYVGLNPSFSPEGFRKYVARHFKTTDKDLYDRLKDEAEVGRLYAWQYDKITDDYLKEMEKIDQASIKEMPYFTKAWKIAENCGLHLVTADLFLPRATTQKDLDAMIFENGKNGTLTAFARKQVDIFNEILHAARPCVVLVANAMAAHILKGYWGDSLRWSDDFGTYTIDVGGGAIPIFFSRMLSGRGALDNHSLERLAWHIKYVKNRK